jgi:hypothetical protein
MSIRQSGLADDFAKLFEAAWVELPAAAAKRLFGGKDEEGVRVAGWKTYDAWVRLANDASNSLYANPTFGTIAGRGIQGGLQVTRVVDAIASAIFGNLWPAIGLPTANDMQALRADVKSMREEIRTLRAETNEAAEVETDDGAYAAGRGAESESAAAAIIWNGYKPTPKRSRKGGKKSVAL